MIEDPVRDVVVGEVGQVATEGVGLDGIGTSGEVRTVDVSISCRNTARFEYCTSASQGAIVRYGCNIGRMLWLPLPQES
ncbi:hypothetical protein B2J88_49865 [Rhodococcus sp. SRB_17]|nr:hypothetical protein [Rhodococcus sp. SRB_17]